MKRIGGILTLLLLLVFSSGYSQTDCLDFSDLKSGNVVLYYTDYQTESIFQIPIEDSFCAVMTDKNAYDIHTDGNLRVIPQGEAVSVKLTGRKKYTETFEVVVGYNYHVDTSLYNSIVLNYAMVLRYGDKRLTTPGFVFRQEGGENEYICPTVNNHTGMYDITGIIDGEYAYQDWSTMKLDLSAYHDKNLQIFVVISNSDEVSDTSDCIYYTLKCYKDEIKVADVCGQDSVRLTAPAGEEYYWYKDGDNNSISSLRTLTVAADNSQYRCRVVYNKQYSCNFDYSVKANRSEAVAQAQYVIDTCKSRINFTSTSYIKTYVEGDSYLQSDADSIAWITDSGTYYGKEFSMIADKNGEYRVKIAAYTAGGCGDTSDWINITVDFNLEIEVTGKTEVCLGDTLHLRAETSLQDVTFEWNTSQTEREITVTPSLTDTLYSVTMYINGECKCTQYVRIKVYPVIDEDVYDTVCHGQSYSFEGQTYTQSGDYTVNFTDTNGCVNTRRLHLHVKETYHDTLFVTRCDTGYYDNGFNAEESGIYTQALMTEDGCDSLVSLSFTRYPVFRDTLHVQIYKGQTFKNDMFEESESGLYNLTYVDTNGCDSVYYLDLDVLHFGFPTLITPNGDGINDVFSISKILEQEMFDETELKIYTRTGKMIYSAKNIRKEEDFWDPEQTKSPSGTYFYRFTAKGKTKNIDFTGSVEVLRSVR